MVDVAATLTAALAGKYTVERELGRGGMAIVFLAHDEKHDRPVAIKVLKPEIATSIGAGRFLREIEVTAQLSHPYIVTLHDSGEVDGLLYYVMPFVEGETQLGPRTPAGLRAIAGRQDPRSDLGLVGARLWRFRLRIGVGLAPKPWNMRTRHTPRGVRSLMPRRSSGTTIGRTLLVTWRKPFSHTATRV